MKNIFKGFFKNVKNFVGKHSPEILTGAGIVAMTTSTVLAIKATPKAEEHIKEEKEALGKDNLNVVEKFKVTWKDYLPSFLAYGAGVACLIESPRQGRRKLAALGAAYTIAENALAKTNQAIEDTVGEKGLKKVISKIDDKFLEETPASPDDIYITNKGNTLFFDTLTKRYFRSDYNRVFKVETELNEMLRDQMTISLNDISMRLGIECLGDWADDVGYDVNNGFIEMRAGSKIASNNEPCIVINYNRWPKAI